MARIAVLGFVAFGRGEVERARALLEDSLAIGRASGEVELVLPAIWGLAETALVAASPARRSRGARPDWTSRWQPASARCWCRSS